MIATIWHHPPDDVALTTPVHIAAFTPTPDDWHAGALVMAEMVRHLDGTPGKAHTVWVCDTCHQPLSGSAITIGDNPERLWVP